VAGVVADGEHFVAQRGDEEQIHLRKEAGHFFGDFAAEAISLDEVDGGQETSGAEKIGPGVVGLDFELVDAVAESEFLESVGAFSEKNEVEGIVGPIGESDFNGHQAEFGESS
jgi:hypothetical protein